MRPAGQDNWKIISITAHRDVSGQDQSLIRSAMKRLVENQTIDAIYVGGARGGDTIALRAASEYRTGSRPWLAVVVPDTVSKQPFEASQWFHLADDVIELGNRITPDDGFSAYQIRNEFLVHVATSLVAFYNGKSGGTGNCVAFATSQGVVVHTIPVRGKV